MNVTQCRMARAAIGWSLDDLAQHSGVSRRTIAKYEAGGNVLPHLRENLRSVFVRHGIEFINGGRRIGVAFLSKLDDAGALPDEAP